jgi:predicted NAD-dependent protein-ADP-ribosyltransferase YbiA (DUF1768 family)
MQQARTKYIYFFAKNNDFGAYCDFRAAADSVFL